MHSNIFVFALIYLSNKATKRSATVHHESKLNNEIHPLNYFQRSREQNASANTVTHADIKLSYEYQSQQFILRL